MVSAATDMHPALVKLIGERKARGITQAEIARRIGISRTAICEAERGFHEPRMRTFVAYAEALGYRVLRGAITKDEALERLRDRFHGDSGSWPGHGTDAESCYMCIVTAEAVAG